MHEFLCHSTPGAILAMTSSAELVATNDINMMRTYIIQHAEAIYRHTNGIRRIGDRESLYIITGCVKTDAWAMAAYREHMQPPHNVLQLVRRPPSLSGRQTPSSSYQWTRQGSSRARLGDSAETGLKNQSLFLQGFKMALAPRFRSRIKESTLASDLELSGAMGENNRGEITASPPGEARGQGVVGSDLASQSSFGSWSLTLDGLNPSSTMDAQDDANVGQGTVYIPLVSYILFTPHYRLSEPLYTAFPHIPETVNPFQSQQAACIH